MAAVIAELHKASVPLQEKLTAACLAAELLAAAPSQQSESACQGIPANKAALQGDAARQSEASIEIRLLPHRIRQRYQDILLDWTISTVCKSAGTTLKAGEGAGGTAVQASLHLDVRAWRLLHALLHVRAAAPNAMLRESVLSTMIAVCSDTHATGALVSAVAQVLTLLMADYRHAFRPSLEHAAQFTAVMLTQKPKTAELLQEWQQLTCLVIRLLRVVSTAHQNQKKVYTAVVGKLLLSLLACGFAPETAKQSSGSQPDDISENTAAPTPLAPSALEARRLLQAALFSASHVPGLSAAASAVAAATGSARSGEEVKGGRDLEGNPHTAAHAGAPADATAAPKHTESLLFKAVAAALAPQAAGTNTSEAAPLLSGLPWLLASYCAALAAYGRQGATDNVTMAVAEVPSAPQKLPVNADFSVFIALAVPLLEAMEFADGCGVEQPPSAKKRRKSSNHAPTSGPVAESAWTQLARAAARLLKEVKTQRVYRPSTDASGTQQALLSRFALAVIDHRPSAPADGEADAAAAAAVVGALLALEHLSLHGHLPRVWPLLWECGAVEVAAQLVRAYGEVRQLEALLSSLAAAALAAPPTLADRATAVLCSRTFTSALQQVIRAAPTGQANALVALVESHLEALLASPPHMLAPLTEMVATCLEALHVDGAMAPAVASGVEAVLERGIEPGLVHLMQQLQLPASDHQLLLLAALLRLHTAAHRVHARCAALRPDLEPLASHSSSSSASHFSCSRDGNPFGDLRAVFGIFAPEARSDAAAAAVLATAGCCGQRLYVLQERTLRQHYTCPLVLKEAPGVRSDDAVSNTHSNAGREEDEASRSAAALSEMLDICAWLLGHATQNKDCPDTLTAAWPGVASQVRWQQLAAALWPQQLDCMAVMSGVPTVPAALLAGRGGTSSLHNGLQQLLKRCFVHMAATDQSGQCAAASADFLSSSQVVNSAVLQPLLPSVLAAQLIMPSLRPWYQRPGQALQAAEHGDAAQLTAGKQASAIAAALGKLNTAIAALGAAPAQSEAVPDVGCAQITPPAAATTVLRWLAHAAPSLCSQGGTNAEQIVVMALLAESMAAADLCSTSQDSSRDLGTLKAARHLLAVVLQLPGPSARAAAASLWEGQGCIVSWVITVWQLGLVQGWDCAATSFCQDTKTVLTAAVGAATEADGSSDKSAILMAFQASVEADLKAWTQRSPLQRLGSALAIEALLAAQAQRSAHRPSSKVLAAVSGMTAGCDAPTAFDSSSPVGKVQAAQQSLLETALCSAIDAAAMIAKDKPTGRSNKNHAASQPVEPQEADLTDSSDADLSALTSLLSAAGHGLASRSAGPTGCYSVSAAEPSTASHPTEQDSHVLLQHSNDHINLAVRLLLTRPADGLSSSPVSPRAQLCDAEALELVGYLQAAVHAKQRKRQAISGHPDQYDPTANDDDLAVNGQQGPDDEQSDEEGSPRTAVAVSMAVENQVQDADTSTQSHCALAHAAQHTELLRLHLDLLQRLAPPTMAPRPLHRGSSLWSGVPSVSSAVRTPAIRLRQALLASFRELLVGGDEGSRRIVHSTLQSRLLVAGAAGAALPALEGALLALEGARGASQSRGLAVVAERFITAVLTFLSRTAATADAQLAGVDGSPAAMAAAAAALATAARCLESVAGRPTVLALSGHHIASILQVPALLFHSPMEGATTFQSLGIQYGAGVFTTAAHAVATTLRKQGSRARRCMALVVLSAQALLSTLASWEAHFTARSRCTQPGRPATSGTDALDLEAEAQLLADCAAAVANLWTTTAEAKDLTRYCVQLLANCLSIALVPHHAQKHQAGDMHPGAVSSAPFHLVLRRGAYALYGACSAAEIQHLYVTLGGKAGGAGRVVLADLKKDFEQHHKYSGKV